MFLGDSLSCLCSSYSITFTISFIEFTFFTSVLSDFPAMFTFTSAFMPEVLFMALMYDRVMISCLSQFCTCSDDVKSGSVTISISGLPERL